MKKQQPLNLIRNTVSTFLPSSSSADEAHQQLQQTLMSKLQEQSVSSHPETLSAQVNDLYLPLFQFFTGLKEVFPTKRPVFVGISAPQGAGKTTLTTSMQLLFQEQSRRCEVLSLDDFYLTFENQTKLAKKFDSNPLLQYRGNAGTHDLPLLEKTLENLKNITDVNVNDNNHEKYSCLIPRFDKSLREGRGDRAPAEDWSVVDGGVDVVLVEGWMFGFEPLHGEEEDALSTDMKDINEYLKEYREIHCLMDAWLVLDAENVEYVYAWRQEAESRMTESGKPGMTEHQVKDFVDRFMPAYEAYLPRLRENGPGRKHCLRSDSFGVCPVLQVREG